MKLVIGQQGQHQDLSSGGSAVTEIHRLLEMVERLHLDVSDIKTSITGGLDGKPGINSRIVSVEASVLDLKTWKDGCNRLFGKFMLKVAITMVVGGGIFGAVIKVVTSIVK